MEGLTSIVDVSNEVLIGLDEHSLSPVIQQPPQNTKPVSSKTFSIMIIDVLNTVMRFRFDCNKNLS